MTDIPHVMAPFSSLPAFVHVARIVGRAAWDRLRYSRTTRLTLGNALAAQLLRSALDAGVELWRNTAMTCLIREDGRISAIDVVREGKAMRIDARRGIILATGGFSANPEMRAKYIPYAEHHISLMPPGNTGDGLNAALAVGAALDSGNAHNAAWNLISLYPRRDGSLGKWPHLLDKPKPGIIIVDRRGMRVGNEADLSFAAAMHRADAVPAYIIADAKAVTKYGFGAVRPGGFGLRRLIKAGYVVEAPSIDQLALQIGVDAVGLAQTVAKMDSYAREGVDLDFGKGSSIFDISMGDPANKPNPCLGPIETPPFYAIKIYPGDATTTLGLRIDARANVLDANDKPIPGLYACGLDINSLWRGIPPANGANNTLSLTFGYIAGREVAGVNMSPTARV